jgi:hypothetical protein
MTSPSRKGRLPKRTDWFPASVSPVHSGPYEAVLENDKSQTVVEVQYDTHQKGWYTSGLYRGILAVRKLVKITKWRGLSERVT